MSGYALNRLEGAEGFVGRYIKPGYYCSNGQEIIVEATQYKPAYFVIGGRIFKVESNLILNKGQSGPGGLRSGLTLAANTSYYIYAVIVEPSVKLIADVIDPSEGVRGYSPWTYIGAFATLEASSTLSPFQSVLGELISSSELEDENHTGDTNSTSKTFASLPTTAKVAHIKMSVNGSASSQSGRVNGRSTTTDENLLTVAQVAGVASYITGFVPVFTAKTLYLRVSNAAATVEAELLGWKEDPSEWL